MRVLDLYSGLGGWSQAFKDRGHTIFTVDFDPQFEADLQKDMWDVTVQDIPWKPDIILASPPCQKFSAMTMFQNWNVDRTPKTVEATKAIELVRKTRDLIDALDPRWYIMENPRAQLRRLDVVADLERRTVTFCQYGEAAMKPTDLWGVYPPSWETRKPCGPRDKCHVGRNNDIVARRADLPESIQKRLDSLAPDRDSKAYRGGFIEDMARFSSHSKERKILTALHARMPYELSLEVARAAENDL